MARSTKGWLYAALKYSNDARVIRRGRIGRRIVRRVYGRVTGRAARRWLG